MKIFGITVGTPMNPQRIAEKVSVPEKVSELENDAGYLTQETDPTVSARISEHNTRTNAHNDIRTLIQRLSDRVNAIANSDDTDLDDFKEVVDYIKANKTLINSVAAAKVNKTDIVNDLVTNVTDKPLGADMGVELKRLIDAIDLSSYATKKEISGYMREADVRALIKSMVLDGYLGGKQLRFANDDGVDGYVTFQKG